MKHSPHHQSKPPIPAAIAAVIVVIATVVLVATFSDSDVETPSDWVYRYQTLIGGFAAIVAAYLTVAQMRVSDERQEERHSAQMRALTTRSQLSLKRFMRLVPHWLRTYAGRVEGLKKYMVNNAVAWTSPEVYSDVAVAVITAHRTLAMLRDPSFENVRELFDEQLYVNWTHVELRLKLITDRTIEQEVRPDIVELGKPPRWYHTGFVVTLIEIDEITRKLADDIERWEKTQRLDG